MPTNSAAILDTPRSRLRVEQAPIPRPAAGQIVVRVRAVALNPLDWIIQGTGPVTYRWLRYPVVLGSDVVGEVVELGAGVTRFAVGDRVVGLATGTDRGRDPRSEGAFQQYTVLVEHLAARVPDAMPDASAAVLPLGVSTAASALFQHGNLGLSLPSTSPVGSGAVVIVWGGSTSVGANAVQLARAAGYDVISTASPKNVERVRTLGAEAVFDYNDPSAPHRIATSVGARKVAGAVAIGAGSASAALRVLAMTGGRRLTMASTDVSLDGLASRSRLFPAMVPVFARIGMSTAGVILRARARGIRASFVWGSSLRDDEVGPAIWQEFLPTALERGVYRPAPEPLVVGAGLESIQAGLDRLRAGVSAQKLVVTL